MPFFLLVLHSLTWHFHFMIHWLWSDISYISLLWLCHHTTNPPPRKWLCIGTPSPNLSSKSNSSPFSLDLHRPRRVLCLKIVSNLCPAHCQCKVLVCIPVMPEQASAQVVEPSSELFILMLIYWFSLGSGNLTAMIETMSTWNKGKSDEDLCNNAAASHQSFVALFCACVFVFKQLLACFPA